ncbi:hypothetical protein [Photobacterium damselae]|uniref:hypothetical protein n=1 Tax=Photobacterium damselae TaxID=38293 RepID=UPI001F4045AA|nr:hypothetical protein [Photobacterium damselae]UKA04553.1 hypothetical protein IHC89_23305 [Photobacterium damselae subsp. damselae]
MSKTSYVLGILSTVLISSGAIANAANTQCSLTHLEKEIGHSDVSFVKCVDINAAKAQFQQDFLSVKKESASLYDKYQKQALMAGLSGNAAAPLIVQAVNNQVTAMYDMASNDKDFSSYMDNLQKYYKFAHCGAKPSSDKKSLVVTCPVRGNLPSFNDVYEISAKGKYLFDSVHFGQINMLKSALDGFQSKLEKMYLDGGVKH